MKPTKVIIISGTILLSIVVLFLLWGLTESNWHYFLPRRAVKLAAIGLTGIAISFSTVSFQTITGNNILTPGIIGLDNLYLFIQTLVVFAMGSRSLVQMSRSFDFLISVSAMVVFSLFLFKVLFRGENRKLFMIILIGMVMGSLFSSLATFMQVMIDPNEFLIVQASMFASFNQVNSSLLGISVILMTIAGLAGFSQIQKLDILSLGRDNVINLGINYESTVRIFMLLISLMISVSTALVGPITFLGLLTANVARQMLQTYKHSYIITTAILISLIALVGGQLIVERIFQFSTPISVIINFIGGLYFLYLLLKEARIK